MHISGESDKICATAGLGRWLRKAHMRALGRGATYLWITHLWIPRSPELRRKTGDL